MEKAQGENQQKQSGSVWAQGTWGPATAGGPLGPVPLAQGKERWGECASFPKCTFLRGLVQPDVSHLSRLARFSGLGCKNSLS